MPNLSPVPPSVIDILNGTWAIRIQEIVAVAWNHGADVRYYGNTNVVDIMPGSTLSANGITYVEPRFKANQFLDMTGSADMGDDEIALQFEDPDNTIKDLWLLSGEGTQVKVLYWLPDGAAGGYLGEYFWGFMKQPKDIGRGHFKIPVAEGFRSPDIKLPRRIIFPGCQAQFGGLVDPVTGLKYLPTLAQRAANDCPYDIDLPGGTIGVPGFTSCPRQSRSDCVARLTDDKSYLAFDVIIEQLPYSGKKRNRFVGSTQANDNVLKDPLRVVAGRRFVDPMTLLGFYTDVPYDHPDRGFLYTLWAVCEGPIQGIDGWTINGNIPKPDNVQIRLGELRQNNSGFSPNGLNYSGTAILRLDYPTENRVWQPEQISASCYVDGMKIRTFNNPPTTSTVQYTNSRAWWLLEILSNRRWGLGHPYSHFHLDDWVWLNAWSDEVAHTVDESGTQVDIPRTRFDAIMEGEDARELVRNVCLAGRYTPPFHVNGKLRVMPLQGESLVSGIPLFTDSINYGTPNILIENGVSSLKWSQKSQTEIPNRVKVTFDNGDQKYNWAEQPIIYEDLYAQLAAGRALGDTTIRVIEKSWQLFGVTRFGEAVRVARLLLDLGEFDSGGLKNNLSIKFKTWFPLGDAIGLHKYRVIKVRSPLLLGFNEPDYPNIDGRFEYFRIMKMRRLGGLQMEIEAQAYPYSYYVNNENAPADRPRPPRVFPNKGHTGLENRRIMATIVIPEIVEQATDHIVVKVVADPASVPTPAPSDH